MTTVREATYSALRDLGMTKIFGNPGSSELPFLKDMPSDFQYVLGLHERVAAGMALGYAIGARRGGLREFAFDRQRGQRAFRASSMHTSATPRS